MPKAIKNRRRVVVTSGTFRELFEHNCVEDRWPEETWRRKTQRFEPTIVTGHVGRDSNN